MTNNTENQNVTNVQNAQTAQDDNLPSTAKLVKSTAIAAVVATGLLVTTVLPGEYGIDPTGVGKLLGLKQMGEIKASLAEEAAADDAAASDACSSDTSTAKVEALGDNEQSSNSNDFGILGWFLPVAHAQETSPQKAMPKAEKSADKAANSGTMTVTLKPNKAAEIKVTMKKGATVSYDWKSNAGKANFDVHGDSKKIKYHRYSKGSVKQKQGKITAAFDGSHGWFWRNRSGKTLTITLNVSGDYGKLIRIK